MSFSCNPSCGKTVTGDLPVQHVVTPGEKMI
jgi:hypothetical protein